jgi:hypothetical protein
MERTKTANSEIWSEDDILVIRLFGELTAEEIGEIARKGIETVEKSKNIKYNLIDISGVKKAPLGAREAAFSSFDGPAKKMAFVCTNPVSRIIGSFFLRRYKMSIPVKMFSSTEEAKKWLREDKE